MDNRNLASSGDTPTWFVWTYVTVTSVMVVATLLVALYGAIVRRKIREHRQRQEAGRG